MASIFSVYEVDIVEFIESMAACMFRLSLRFSGSGSSKYDLSMWIQILSGFSLKYCDLLVVFFVERNEADELRALYILYLES